MGAQYVTLDSKIYCEKVKMCRFSSGNWFFCTKFVQHAMAGKRRNIVVHLQKRVINCTWLRLSISDWSIIMIGPGGLLLVVPMYMQVRLQFYWWGCQKKKKGKLRHLILLSKVTYWAPVDILLDWCQATTLVWKMIVGNVMVGMKMWSMQQISRVFWTSASEKSQVARDFQGEES
jgi:hypothetical protein